MKIKMQVVSDILKWIEENLDNNIRIEDVVNKSGYSRRGIQLIFKEYTGLPLGSYIRHRKLCRSAMLLRLTNQSIFDISDQLGFDSQTSFSREFKKYFDYTPNKYRANPSWDLKKFRARIILDEGNQLVPSFRYLNDDAIFGCNNNSYKISYQKSFLQPSTNDNDIRLDIVKKNIKTSKKTLLILSKFKPSKLDHHILDIDTIIAFEDSIIKSNEGHKRYDIDSGLYVMFPYKGNWSELSSFSRKIYTEIFPAYGLSRRPGYDIEIFYYNDSLLLDDYSDITVECDYYIPISK
ncbi:hypothetical protein CRN84_11700 [Budvicia aquatica]|uniref:HTH araC/xylS-type domain-containing protein n=2 Tax=Budvicia aquatica TaxID=82979 RepID=A0A2C6DMG5_9GAMM|nr:hypothetical protein CRN84_11700 [Budvicia aquatica]